MSTNSYSPRAQEITALLRDVDRDRVALLVKMLDEHAVPVDASASEARALLYQTKLGVRLTLEAVGKAQRKRSAPDRAQP